MGVTLSVELFQDPRDVAAFILSVRNVYLGGFPASTHGNDDGRIAGLVTSPNSGSPRRTAGRFRLARNKRNDPASTTSVPGYASAEGTALPLQLTTRSPPKKSSNLPSNPITLFWWRLERTRSSSQTPSSDGRRRLVEMSRFHRVVTSMLCDRLPTRGGVVCNRHITNSSSSPALCSPVTRLPKGGLARL